MKSLVGILVVAAISVTAACTEQQFGTGAVPPFADAGAGPSVPVDASADVEAGTSTCAQLAAIPAPKTCNGEPGSGAITACSSGLAVCAAASACTSLASGTVFSITTDATYRTCAEAGAAACSAGKAFGLNESHDFQGWCVCGSPPGTACGVDAECSNLRCNADKKCGGAANEACTPLGPLEIALLPETQCRTTCSRTTCTCEPACKVDADCGGPTSGRVCNSASTCVGGCRGTNGNGCASSFDHCTSQSSLVGICTDGL